MNTRFIIKLLVLLMTLSLTLTGCAVGAGEQVQEEEDVSHYLSTIATLESELQTQKEAFYIKESVYQTEIAELRSQISTLLGQVENTQTTQTVFRYRVEEGEAVITGYSGSAALLTIPATLDGYPVKAIGERVFEDTEIAAVVIPEGVREVGWFAFYGCEDLINITLPASVTIIGYAVFDGCTSLSIYCPAGSYAEQYAKSYGIDCIAN